MEPLIVVWFTLVVIAIPVTFLNSFRAFNTKEYIFVTGVYFTVLGIVGTVAVFALEPMKSEIPYWSYWFVPLFTHLIGVLFFASGIFIGKAEEEVKTNMEEEEDDDDED